ncbi:4'-phosphopantetheinyl transferase family protein [Crenalkalicoccus roseus]|uniref:4'-phosphopantetheinyl transferase family protein n=1 Tax=Crenalkalicoccus roseus TaxID=1485588 RepID=UPI001080766C|nr:4'-phosphopantetheinyl transferase superfamily protein [Crenalkalicoccus roseus]
MLIRTLPLRGLGEAEIAPLLAVLDGTERARAERFAFARNRIQFVAAHALTRATLAAIGGAPPAAWRFVPGPHGKPAALLGDRPSALSFNLSHTEGMVGVAAIAVPEAMLGFDLEPARRGVSERLARSVFRPEELAWLAALPPAERGFGAMRLWTLKEAFIKATGRGVGQGLSTFWFELPPPRLRLAPGVPGRPEEWLFDQRLLGGDVLGAVGLRCGDGAPPRLDWQGCDLPALRRELGGERASGARRGPGAD